MSPFKKFCNIFYLHLNLKIKQEKNYKIRHKTKTYNEIIEDSTIKPLNAFLTLTCYKNQKTTNKK